MAVAYLTPSAHLGLHSQCLRLSLPHCQSSNKTIVCLCLALFLISTMQLYPVDKSLSWMIVFTGATILPRAPKKKKNRTESESHKSQMDSSVSLTIPSSPQRDSMPSAPIRISGLMCLHSATHSETLTLFRTPLSAARTEQEGEKRAVMSDYDSSPRRAVTVKTPV